ncbi:MAG: hypothetical protein K2I64_01695 [Muribaculaceae bacterium]|nr:hypothetical protein [Muribaculaceae bacterium]
MKRNLSIGLALLAAATASAQSEHLTADTLKTISNAENITITRSGNQTVIRALQPNENKGGGTLFTYTVTEEPDSMLDRLTQLESIQDEKNAGEIFRLPFATDKGRHTDKPFKTSRFITGARYIYWGWNFNYDYKGGTKNCFEYSIADLIGVEWETSRHTRLGFGLGFGLQRVTTADHRLFATEGDVLTIEGLPEGVDHEFSRLDNWRIQLPLYWRQRLTGSFGISLAAIANFNVYSSAKNRFSIDKTTYTETITGLRQRLLTCDVMATVGFVDAIGVYVKWSPASTFSREYGPSFKTISVGITLNF